MRSTGATSEGAAEDAGAGDIGDESDPLVAGVDVAALSGGQSLARRALRSGHSVERRCRAVLSPLVGCLSGGVLEICYAVPFERGLHRHALRIAQVGPLAPHQF